MEISRTETSGGVIIIAITDRLDSVTAPEAEKAMAAIIAEGHHKVLFDFSQLEYLSSDGLRIILGTAKQLSERGGKMVLCALKDYVKEIFEVSRFTSLFPIKDTVDDALMEFE